MRKRLTERFPWLLPVRRRQRILFFYIGMRFDRKPYAYVQSSEALPEVIFTSSCPVFNEKTGFDMIYQENKLHNLRLAARKINGLLIRPGETFSFWNRVRHADKDVPYKDALTEINGVLQTEYGGGLCMLSNMLNWIFLHSPLTLTERHGHFKKDFPEPESDALVGVDATVAEGWKDFCVRNDTKMTFQIGIAFDDNNIIGTVFASDDPRCQYVVKNENLHYAKAGDAVTETVDVIRNTIDPHTGKLLSHDLIYQNRCLIGYETDLSL